MLLFFQLEEQVDINKECQQDAFLDSTHNRVVKILEYGTRPTMYLHTSKMYVS